MALQKYKVHTARCVEINKAEKIKISTRRFTKCPCNYSVEGILRGEFIRKGSGTSCAGVVDDMIREAELTGIWPNLKKKIPEFPSPSVPVLVKPENGITVVQSIKEYTGYLASTTDGVLKPGSLTNNRSILNSFLRWTEDENIIYARDLRPLHAKNYMESRGAVNKRGEAALSVNTQPNYVTCLNGYGEWLDDKEYCVGNFARKLEPPKGIAVKRVPISDEKFKLLVKLSHQITEARPATVTGYEVETVMQIMRRAGMGIADGATLDPSEIVGREIQYYRTKTEDEPIPC